MNTRVQGSTTIFANETNTPEPTSNKSPTPTRAVAKAVRDLAAPAESDSVDKGVEVTDLDFSPTPQDRYGNGATPSMASASSHTTGTADTKSAFNIKLPNGVQISVGALIRLLDRATTVSLLAFQSQSGCCVRTSSHSYHFQTLLYSTKRLAETGKRSFSFADTMASTFGLFSFSKTTTTQKRLLLLEEC